MFHTIDQIKVLGVNRTCFLEGHLNLQELEIQGASRPSF